MQALFLRFVHQISRNGAPYYPRDARARSKIRASLQDLPDVGTMSQRPNGVIEVNLAGDYDQVTKLRTKFQRPIDRIKHTA
jgi:hypothetical protein